MAARLQALQSKVAEASRLVAKNGCAYYKQTMEKNKKYVVEPPTVEKCQDLSKQLFYTRLARKVEEQISFQAILVHLVGKLKNRYPFSIPGRYEAFWKELDGVKHMWKNRHELKVEDAGIAALFGIELYAWFCVGEIMGRGFTLTGYYP